MRAGWKIYETSKYASTNDTNSVFPLRRTCGIMNPAEKPGIALDACSEGERMEPGTEMPLVMELADILRTSMDALTDVAQI